MSLLGSSFVSRALSDDVWRVQDGPDAPDCTLPRRAVKQHIHRASLPDEAAGSRAHHHHCLTGHQVVSAGDARGLTEGPSGLVYGRSGAVCSPPHTLSQLSVPPRRPARDASDRRPSRSPVPHDDGVSAGSSHNLAAAWSMASPAGDVACLTKTSAKTDTDGATAIPPRRCSTCW